MLTVVNKVRIRPNSCLEELGFPYLYSIHSTMDMIETYNMYPKKWPWSLCSLLSPHSLAKFSRSFTTWAQPPFQFQFLLFPYNSIRSKVIDCGLFLWQTFHFKSICLFSCFIGIKFVPSLYIWTWAHICVHAHTHTHTHTPISFCI